MGLITPALKNKVKYLPLLLLTLLSFSASAQKRVSADVEVKQVAQGKVTTITKSVYCANNGRLVVHFHTPEDYYVVTNILGETKLFVPRTNEVLMDNSDAISSKDDLLTLFLSGRVEDLGLSLSGYKLQSAVNEEGKIVRTYVTTDKNRPAKVEIVLENYLPIYMEDVNETGKVTRKTYFSKYQTSGRFTFPTRTTEVAYVAKDSTVTRTVYSNIKVDQDDPDFNFEIPANAKTVTIQSK